MRHALVLAFVLCSSCASILDGGPDVLSVSSEPEGATVHLHGSPVGKTPMQVTIPRNDFDKMEFCLEGFHTQHVQLVKDINGWVFGNILFGGVVGLIVDLASYNVTKVSTAEPLHVVLVPASRPAPFLIRFPQPRPHNQPEPASSSGWRAPDGE